MKKIIITVLIISAFIILGSAASIFGQDSADYSGMWTVTWLDNNTNNPMSLNQENGQLTGIYTNDKKESCSITGEYIKKDGRIKFSVKCPNWGIEMEGLLSSDGKSIAGNYTAYGNSTGNFIMKKNDK